MKDDDLSTSPRREKKASGSKRGGSRTERKKIEEALQESETRHRRIVENIEGYAIFGLDKNGIISSWNRGVERVLGYSEEEFIGRPGAIIFTEADRKRGEAEKEIRTALVRGSVPDERWHVRKDGSLFWASGIMTALRDGSGSVIGLAKILRDNTERKHAQDALQAAHTELELRVIERTVELSKAVRLLEKEIAERQALELAVLRAIDEERHRFGQELHDGICQHLTGTGILAGTVAKRLAAQGIEEAERVREIAELVTNAADQARALAKGLYPVMISSGGLGSALRELAGQVSRSIHCSVECPVPIELDEAKALHLYRIAQEAVGNALKHSNAKSIVIACVRQGDQLVLSVSDNGSGFDKTAIEHGMGLFNMAHRAKVLGASLVVESHTGGGTRVICTLQNATARDSQ